MPVEGAECGLLGCLGAGAALGAAYLPRVRQRVSVDRLLIIATFVFAIATLALAYLHNLIVVGIALLAAGFAWLVTPSLLFANCTPFLSMESSSQENL